MPSLQPQTLHQLEPLYLIYSFFSSLSLPTLHVRNFIEALIMADPLSVAASTLAILGFAAQSSKLLHDVFLSVSEAPKEIQQHLSTIHALTSTFMAIQALGQQIPPEHAWSPEFLNNLNACMEDFRDVESKIKKLSNHLEKRSMHRAWARLMWSSKDCYRNFSSEFRHIMLRFLCIC